MVCPPCPWYFRCKRSLAGATTLRLCIHRGQHTSSRHTCRRFCTSYMSSCGVLLGGCRSSSWYGTCYSSQHQRAASQYCGCAGESCAFRSDIVISPGHECCDVADHEWLILAGWFSWPQRHCSHSSSHPSIPEAWPRGEQRHGRARRHKHFWCYTMMGQLIFCGVRCPSWTPWGCMDGARAAATLWQKAPLLPATSTTRPMASLMPIGVPH